MKTLPPGPRGHWLQGSLPDFRAARLDFFVGMREQFGDVVRVRLGPRRVYLLFHPDAIEETLVEKNHCFRKHFALRLNPLVLGNGLLTSEGDFWLRQRRLVQPAFNRGRIGGYGPAMVAEARRLADTWKSGEHRDIMTEMSKLTLAIAARTLFSAEVGGHAEEVVEAMHILQNHFLRRFNSLLPPPQWLPTPANLRFRRAVRRLDAILFDFIRDRRQHGSTHKDLLSLLLDARDEDGSRMNDHQVRDEAMTLFLAGHETTALALSWTWYLLAKHPEAEAKLVAEWQAVLGGREPTPDDWPRLRFTEQVVQESMRLYPPAYVVGREALFRLEIAGYPVERGTTLLMPEWAVHRDPRFWMEPERFRPERWGEEAIRSLPKFAYYPFGGGPRLCVGNLFAMMEMVLVMATVGQRFRFALEPGATVHPEPTFTLRPTPGVPMRIEARSALSESGAMSEPRPSGSS
jgi:cytochrome P450